MSESFFGDAINVSPVDLSRHKQEDVPAAGSVDAFAFRISQLFSATKSAILGEDGPGPVKVIDQREIDMRDPDWRIKQLAINGLNGKHVQSIIAKRHEVRDKLRSELSAHD